MHMVWINLIPQLIDLWIGKFNELGEGKEAYRIHSKLWSKLGDICDASGSTIPTSFGRRIPHLTKRSQFTAEFWCLFATQIAPNILRGCFKKPTYYVHFVNLINLIEEVTDYSISREELPRIRKGFADWVREYERIYYQHNPGRLQACNVNVHYLLHIVDSIEFAGPPSCYWSYVMERFCSFVGYAVKSRQDPFSNISRRVRDMAQLQMLGHLYDLRKTITFAQTHASTEAAGMAENDQADQIPDSTFLASLRIGGEYKSQEAAI
ncbi:hypothetical protein FRC06_002771 [Ceratobasidium sp. 370]|nr:hypothetical protein FRC06_002771 [Ceratobasidium sp. 370]